MSDQCDNRNRRIRNEQRPYSNRRDVDMRVNNYNLQIVSPRRLHTLITTARRHRDILCRIAILLGLTSVSVPEIPDSTTGGLQGELANLTESNHLFAREIERAIRGRLPFGTYQTYWITSLHSSTLYRIIHLFNTIHYIFSIYIQILLFVFNRIYWKQKNYKIQNRLLSPKRFI